MSKRLTQAQKIEAAMRKAFQRYGAPEAVNEAWFIDGETWRASNMHYLNDAVLVMSVDGLAYDVIHSGDEEWEELLDKTLERLGVYYDFGENWQVGFIPNE